MNTSSPKHARACVCIHVHACSVMSDSFQPKPVDGSPPGSSVHGILQARKLEQIAISSSRGSFPPSNRTHISSVSCIGRQVLYQLSHQGSPVISTFKIQWILQAASSVHSSSSQIPCLVSMLQTQSENKRGKSQLLFQTCYHSQEAPGTLRKNQSVWSHHWDRSQSWVSFHQFIAKILSPDCSSLISDNTLRGKHASAPLFPSL